MSDPTSTGGAPAGASSPGTPMSRMRRMIAERLTRSTTTIPQFAAAVSVDVTSLLALRRTLASPERAAPTLTDFVVGAAACAIAAHPMVNGLTDGTMFWSRPDINVGIAVDVEGGLVVPVIRNADRLALPELATRCKVAVSAARARALKATDLQGGTFTVSNLGMLGVEEFQAIVTPGESAILAVGAAPWAPTVVDGAVVARRLMRLTLTSDHRLIDGALAARFLATLRERLEDAPAWAAEWSPS